MGGIVHKSIKEKPRLRNEIAYSPPPLENNDEMCYMNAVFQALGSCDKMRDDLRKLESEYKSIKLKLFIDLLYALNSRHAQDEFDSFISLCGWCMKGQQDSYEVMSFIIMSIYKDMRENAYILPINDKRTRFPGIITLCSQTNCACESKNLNRLQDFALHLPLVNKGGMKYNIEEMINAIFKSDTVDDLCNKCHSSQTLSLTIDEKLPRTLCLHIQANKYDKGSGTIIKPKYKLEYPYYLEIQGLMYELVSFLDHSGGVSVGHYVAYRKYFGEWFSVNDTFVDHLSKVDLPMKHCNKPYILFYELLCDS